MKKKLETIKVDSGLVEKVRANKEKTGVPIAVFFEKAAEEKLEKEKV